MYRVAILGASGAVGQELLRVLEDRRFPLSELRLLASERSSGRSVRFRGADIPLETATPDSFAGLDLVLASAGGSVSAAYEQAIVASGATLIDNSSRFRMRPDVPLVVPEINPEAIAGHRGIIANPNCSAIIMCLPLWPLHRRWRIRRVVAATYQAASGAGAAFMDELVQESLALSAGNPFTRVKLPHQYAFNLFPHNSPMTGTGYCEEEVKIAEETRKIFGEGAPSVTATCVRVPVLRAHSEALNVEFDSEPDVAEAYAILSSAPGVRVLEDRAVNRWPMPVDATGQDDVLVGRLRKDASHPKALELWVVGDQLRKGAALNAVQIAELLTR